MLADLAEALWPLFRGVLNDDEQARAARFRRAGDAQAFVATHALLRVCLSIASQRHAASAWQFTTGSHGKPHVTGRGPCFSLSHTAGAVAVAVGNQALGVDIERIDDGRLRPDLAQAVLAPEECSLLDVTPAAERAETAFAIWTLKEAYVKALGIGLSLPFDLFAVGLDPPRLLRGADPSAWLLDLRRPAPGYMLALARPAGAGALDARAITPTELECALKVPAAPTVRRCSGS